MLSTDRSLRRRDTQRSTRVFHFSHVIEDVLGSSKFFENDPMTELNAGFIWSSATWLQWRLASRGLEFLNPLTCLLVVSFLFEPSFPSACSRPCRTCVTGRRSQTNSRPGEGAPAARGF